ncbi:MULTISPECIES: hypothetical protein [Burkholderia]|uniref:hypothetical protein n=1 Tax=Burkholderia TaxID=32008 RepID=UPI00158C2B67|nr:MULTISPECIES: hypothetical protein [Burkholderia]MDI9694459.1 hypothetical protein [Burkholderia cenocepacia]
MRVYVGFISITAGLINEFNNAKEALIPKPIKDKFPKACEFKFDAFNPTNSKGNFTVDKHILEGSRGYDYGMCLIEQDLDYLCGNIRYAILSATIDPDEALNRSARNFLSSHLNKMFKAAIFTIEKMSAAEVEHAMRLPRRNFDAPELSELCRIYREDVLDGEFHNAAKQKIFEIGKRRQPRRRSSFRTKYFIDDKLRYFVFGKEDHEVLPTGDPHEPHCELNGNFRFGRRISIDRHFNVSQGDGDDTYILGTYPNCHDAPVTPEKNRTHLNMFSNDHC